MFLQAWDVAADWHTDEYAYYMRVKDQQVPTSSIIAPYADAPENQEDTASNVYCQILDLAEDYVHIMTPYLILDERMRKSLEFAAQRGIEVCILLPHIPDKKIVFMIARSYYPELIKAGIKVYEYTPGFLHSKMFVSDDCVSTVGSVNLDFRSLFLHFENGVLLCGTDSVKDIRRDFEEALHISHEVTMEEVKHTNILLVLIRAVLHVFMPLV